jgi:hypothetical protein
MACGMVCSCQQIDQYPADLCTPAVLLVDLPLPFSPGSTNHLATEQQRREIFVGGPGHTQRKFVPTGLYQGGYLDCIP